MTFTENSQMVKSMIMLIMAGMITLEDVPDLGNLKEVVELVLTK